MKPEEFLKLPSIKRLRYYVDGYIAAAGCKDEEATVRWLQPIRNVMEKMRREHRKHPFPSGLIVELNAERERAGAPSDVDWGLETVPAEPQLRQKRRSICWKCGVTVDERIHAMCTCDWIICPYCGACEDPRWGSCQEYVVRLTAELPPETLSAIYSED